MKLCSMSPKDARGGNCLFTCVDDVIQVITRESERTKNWKTKHLVMKKKREFFAEYRCLWIKDRLRAVITLTECDSAQKKKVKDFFSRYKFDLPHTGCVEIGESRENGLEVIEINPLGPDLRCMIDPFSWEDDWYRLYSTHNVIYVSIL